jgi:hypothetical protein
VAETTARPLRVNGTGLTERRDNWWVEPALSALILGSFGIYATWAAFQGVNYEWGPYLSPFYSPNMKEFFPDLSFSPAILILGFPLAFRATCYYYRKAYYRAFFMDPPACAVGEPMLPGRKPHTYKGETAFPFILQNLHRYAFYAAALFVVVLWYDAIKAFFFNDGFHVGLGSIVLLVNVIFLSLYTFSCHSWRHLIGGKLDCFSCDKMAKTRYGAWQRVSIINEKHMQWAWISLFTVAIADIYVRLVASGVIQDVRLF